MIVKWLLVLITLPTTFRLPSTLDGVCSKHFPVSSQFHMRAGLFFNPRDDSSASNALTWLVTTTWFNILALDEPKGSAFLIVSSGWRLFKLCHRSFVGGPCLKTDACILWLRAPVPWSSCLLVIPIPCFAAVFTVSTILLSTSGGRAGRRPGRIPIKVFPLTLSWRVDLGTLNSFAAPLIDSLLSGYRSMHLIFAVPHFLSPSFINIILWHCLKIT